jgi:hypothetical protein
MLLNYFDENTFGIAIFLSVVASNKSKGLVRVQSWYYLGKSVEKT